MLELAKVQRMPFVGEPLLGQTEADLARGAGGPGMVQNQFTHRRPYVPAVRRPPWSLGERPAVSQPHDGCQPIVVSSEVRRRCRLPLPWRTRMAGLDQEVDADADLRHGKLCFDIQGLI